MAGVKVSELEYQGRLDGRHAWVHDDSGSTGQRKPTW